MPNKKIMVLDLITDLLNEEGNLIGKLVIDKAGNELKVKKGQGGKLADRWDELEAGSAYEFDIGKYTPPGKSTSYDFVQDFRKVDNVFVKEAQKQVIDVQIIAKNKSVALSYAKDLLVANKIDGMEIFLWADKFYRFMVGDIDLGRPPFNDIKEVEVKDETTEVVKDNKVTNEPPEEGQVPRQDSGEATDQETKPEYSKVDEQIIRIRQLGMDLAWGQKKAKAHLKTLFGKSSTGELTSEELDTLEGDLQVRVKST